MQLAKQTYLIDRCHLCVYDIIYMQILESGEADLGIQHLSADQAEAQARLILWVIFWVL